MACIALPDAGVLRPVDLTGVSGRPNFLENREPTALFVGDLYLSLRASSSSPLLAIYIDVATL